MGADRPETVLRRRDEGHRSHGPSHPEPAATRGDGHAAPRPAHQRLRAWNFRISAAAAGPKAPRMVASVSIAMAVSTSE